MVPISSRIQYAVGYVVREEVYLVYVEDVLISLSKKTWTKRPHARIHRQTQVYASDEHVFSSAQG